MGIELDEGASAEADPASLYFYVRSVFIAWLWLALGCGFLMIGLAYVGNLLAGDRGNAAGAAIGSSAAFFCIAGAAYAQWRLWFALLARHRAQKHGTDDRYRKWARRATPRNSSLVLQVLVGAFAFYLTITRL